MGDFLTETSISFRQRQGYKHLQFPRLIQPRHYLRPYQSPRAHLLAWVIPAHYQSHCQIGATDEGIDRQRKYAQHPLLYYKYAQHPLLYYT
jgi:hypothetical protein